MKEKRDIIRPVILKVGVALALSFAGFLYSRFKNKRPKLSQPPHSPFPSDQAGKALVEGRTPMEKTPPISRSGDSVSVDIHEDTFRPRVAINNITVVDSPNNRNNDDIDGYLLPELNDVVKEFGTSPTNASICLKKELETSMSDLETCQAFRSKEKEEYEQEIRHLKDIVGDLQEREKSLEFQLLEFYGLKEQETALLELHNRLELSNMEVKLLTLKMESLQAENHKLHEQVAGQEKLASELDTARAKIKLLRKMFRSEAEKNRQQILTLRDKVIRLQEQEASGVGSDMQQTLQEQEAAGVGSDMQQKLQKLKKLEAQVEDLSKTNLKLQHENSELVRKCESKQVLANSVLEDPETEALRKLTNQLREENEELEKKVDRLQADRCTDVEELVYLRWINACLRYELRNFKPGNGKTVAKDLSRSLSPESEAKAKQLILEYAYNEGTEEKGVNIMDFDSDRWSSSHHSYVVDSGDIEEPPKENNNSSKAKFFKKLRKLIRGKEAQFHHQNQGSSADRTPVTEDFDSWGVNSGISTATDAGKSLSPESYGVSFRRSADIPRLKIGRRYSDIGLIHDQKRAFSARMTSPFTSPENQVEQGWYAREKSELKKFAEVLKGSESKTSKSHRKSTSLGSLMGVKSSTSE
ncbi:protein CHUP1, chloroplastic isoform X2 [Euphorbia lathyris]|uniref:protein CHUP1, chloroplastic isoform X2 n=1 Tax=Euphorbia lathyris TaxID=212925 RepID=UPI0033131940